MNRRPPWLGWAIPPLLLPLAVMAWICSNWDRIPPRYAVHFGPGNRPDRWQTRTPLHVFGFPIFAEGLVTLLLVLMLCTWYGSRRSDSRPPVEKIMLGVMYLMSVVFTVVGLMPVVQLPAWPLAVVIPIAAIGLIVYIASQAGLPDAPTRETPQECWSVGGIYYNPQDPDLFVPARWGTGYTLNMANRWAYVFMTTLLLGIVVLVGFLLWSLR